MVITLRSFLRSYKRFKPQLEAGKALEIQDRQRHRFRIQRVKPSRHVGAGKHLAPRQPLSPEPIPASEWKGLA
jgi:hypothetical protein